MRIESLFKIFYRDVFGLRTHFVPTSNEGGREDSDCSIPAWKVSVRLRLTRNEAIEVRNLNEK